jgi:hypothetical protein
MRSAEQQADHQVRKQFAASRGWRHELFSPTLDARKIRITKTVYNLSSAELETRMMLQRVQALPHKNAMCAFRRRRPLVPTHDVHSFRTMTSGVAQVLGCAVGCIS